MDNTASTHKPCRNYQRQVHSAAPKNIPKQPENPKTASTQEGFVPSVFNWGKLASLPDPEDSEGVATLLET